MFSSIKGIFERIIDIKNKYNNDKSEQNKILFPKLHAKKYAKIIVKKAKIIKIKDFIKEIILKEFFELNRVVIKHTNTKYTNEVKT